MAEKKEAKEAPAEEVDIFQSSLVPKHEILSEDERRDLLSRLKIEEKQLPRIKPGDPAAKKLGAKKGDILRISRKSPTSGDYQYFRLVA
jgi:DNA-directed RNA polymerase subunit H (RpoH/RPB5)